MLGLSGMYECQSVLVIAGSVGAQGYKGIRGTMAFDGGIGAIRGCRVSGMHWQAGRKCRGSGASKGHLGPAGV